MTTLATFASAYRQLRPSEKAFVDGYVARVEREAAQINERISNALYRPIPPAVVEASRGMLEMPLVLAAITERINDIAAQSELTVHRVVKELMAVAFSSLGDYMKVDEITGQPAFDLSKATPEMLSAIQSIDIEEVPRTGARKFKIRLHDKLSGIDKLARYMGMLETDNPFYRASQARPTDLAALPATTTMDQAGDAYAAMING